MAGGKESPRQKMIGMMYLVLTALLAMNVSKEILNAFVIVNEGLQVSNEIFEKKNQGLLADFKTAYDKDKKKVEPYFKLANKAKEMTEELNKHIIELKKELVKTTDGKDQAAADTLIDKMMGIDAKDNYDKPTYLMIGDDPATPRPATDKFSALELKGKVEKFRSEMAGLFKDPKLFLPAVTKGMEQKVNAALSLPGAVENGVPAPWEVVQFHHLPLAAVITNLSKLQTDINNIESEVVGTLYQAVKGKDVTFDKLVAKVIAPSSYILSGTEYKADILLVAFNSTSNPKIFIGDVDTTIKDEKKNMLKGPGTELKDISAGAGHYVTTTGAEGEQKFGGVIEVETPEGKKYYPFMGDYTVAKPALAISPTKMNVLYIGVDNPVDISAAGVAPGNLSPSVSGGSIKSVGPGKYLVRVNGGTEATISVAARGKDGKASPAGPPMKFRVRSIPDPVAYVAGKKGDANITKGELATVAGVIPKLENCEFDLRFDVTGFDMVMNLKGDFITESAQGNKLTDKQQMLVRKAGVGSRVFFENVRVSGQDGTKRKIAGVTLKVK